MMTRLTGCLILVLVAASAVAGGDEPVTAKEEPAVVTTATAIFAGGCFWCMEPPFDQLEGVLATESGYTGGHLPNPTYRQVSAGGSGHLEAVRVTYDPERIGYGTLLDVFWQNIDPFDARGQFCDKGEQYRSAIFYSTPQQHKWAEQSRAQLATRFAGQHIDTRVLPAQQFYPAEEYHQDYYLKNPIRYKFYRYNCGRDRRLRAVWGSAPH